MRYDASVEIYSILLREPFWLTIEQIRGMTARQLDELYIFPAVQQAKRLRAEIEAAKVGSDVTSGKKIHTREERLIEECYWPDGRAKTDAEMDAAMLNWMRGAGGLSRMKPERFRAWAQASLRDDRAARPERRQRAEEALKMREGVSGKWN